MIFRSFERWHARPPGEAQGETLILSSVKRDLMNTGRKTYRSKQRGSGYARRWKRSLTRRVAVEQLEEKCLLAVFPVDSIADQVDQNPGDGVCEVSPGGACTLRAAVMEANAWGTSEQPDQILLPAGNYVFTLPGNGNLAGDLDITQSVILTGAGAASTVIDGNGFDRVFDIQNGNVEIRGVTIQGGLVDDSEDLLAGTGGGVRNEGTLLLADSVVTGNQATRGAGLGNYNGTLSVQRCVITGNGNASTQSGGGIENFSYYDPASLSLTDSTVSGNRAAHGGGVNNHAYDGVAAAVLTSSTISGNHADNGGGIANRGVYYAEQGTDAVLTIVGSTISGNLADVSGAGVHSQASADSAATLSIANSTIARNTATGGTGGGIHVVNSTGANTTLKSSLVADNTAVGGGPDLFIVSVTASYSLIENAGGHGLIDGVDNNLIGDDPLLADLADNGGLTWTHAIGPGSPAIDQGINSDGLSGDQRGSGFARTIDDAAAVNASDGTDIGSIEVGQTGALYDFGDAPEGMVVGDVLRSYPTQLSSDGARHLLVPGGPKLGITNCDSEPDAFPAMTASGDDLVGFDDEDGLVNGAATLIPGTLMDDVNITHDGGDSGAFLNVWIDLNLDGDWDDMGEHLVDDLLVPAGFSTTSLETLLVPASIPVGTTFMRLRISTEAGLEITGAASDGEVEDFALAVGTAPTQIADLSLTNVVNDSEPDLNETVRFTITMSNAGPVMATGIEVSALLPFELLFVGASVSTGIYDDFDGVWLVDQLLPGQSASLQIDAMIETTDNVLLTAEIVASDQLDSDSTPGNGISSEDDQASAALGTCLVATALHPGLNRLQYVCSTPNAFTGFVRGTSRGTTTFSDYQVTVDIADAERMAIGIADGNGLAEVFFQVDEADLAQPLLVQAFEMFPSAKKGNTLSLGQSEQFLKAAETGKGAAHLQPEVIRPTVLQALTSWNSAGADPLLLRQLADVSVTIADLPGNVLARTVGRAIVLDQDAAGNGWFVDPTPWDNSEFGDQGQSGYAVVGPAADGIDLLTTLTHEFGHLLDLDDTRDIQDVMNYLLGTGRRVLPEIQPLTAMSFDASGDGRVSAVDALWVINYLAQQDSNFADQRFWQGQQDMDWASLDINHDGVVSAVDALHVIDELARQQFATGEAEGLSLRGMGDADTTGVLVDLAHADLFFEEPLRENRWMSVAGDEPLERQSANRTKLTGASIVRPVHHVTAGENGDLLGQTHEGALPVNCSVFDDIHANLMVSEDALSLRGSLTLR